MFNPFTTGEFYKIHIPCDLWIYLYRPTSILTLNENILQVFILSFMVILLGAQGLSDRENTILPIRNFLIDKWFQL